MVRVFGAKGYFKAFYDDIVTASGVSRKSLYSAFGDKQAVFVKALQRYRTDQARVFLEYLDAAAITLPDIRAIFQRLGTMARSEDGRWGCLMANTATAGAIEIPDLKDQLDRHLTTTTDRLESALKKAGVPSGRIEAKAWFLTGALQGLFVLAHARADDELVDAYVGGLLERLE